MADPPERLQPRDDSAAETRREISILLLCVVIAVLTGLLFSRDGSHAPEDVRPDPQPLQRLDAQR